MTDQCYAVTVNEKYSVRTELNKELDFGKVHWTSPGKVNLCCNPILNLAIKHIIYHINCL